MDRVSEIENKISMNELNAAQVFTQMRQLITKDEWISVVDELPPLKEILDKPLSVSGEDIPPLNISIKVLRIIRGEVSVGAVEWFDHGWVNATRWQLLPPTK